MNMQQFKIIIVEDVALELKGTEGIIRNDIPEAQIIGTANSEMAYWKLINQQLPDLVLLDLGLGGSTTVGVEICRQAGVPYSTLRTGTAKQRDFNIIKLALNIERERLFDRINRRVDRMIEMGLEQEARSVYHLRHLNSLNTVGMKEMFALFDGTMDRKTAIERMKKNTRVYAKKQLTWYRRDPDITWVTPDDAVTVALSRLDS